MSGSVVMITGAGRGIGASIARLLHHRGARLVLTDIDEASLQGLAVELGDKTVACITCDVTDFEGMQAAADTAIARFGGVDVVVANAGIEQWAPVRTVEPADFRRVIETNVIGVFNTVRAVLPSIIERRGYVLVVSSVSSYTALPGMASYAASKAGAEQFANVLRMELSAHGVRVGSAHMSLVDTPMLGETKSSAPSFAKLLAALPPPLRRPIAVDECAARLVTAIERRARYVHVPRWVAATRWLKPLLSTPAAQRPMTKQMKRIET
ncbi:SDR family oxidoreductase [Mycobacterium sp. GA-1841]|uniref:SDR family oxidoreductase n=1 Tax=Mycobacterium sp. GA-1841 TaxID=1834154 RepID=UPI0020C9E9DE|nr:SDR family oxidoreductase [Mycobacterium sp. GA-1841]